MRKTLSFLLLVLILILTVSCGEDDANVSGVALKEIDVSNITDVSETFLIDSSSEIKLTNIQDDEAYVINVSPITTKSLNVRGNDKSESVVISETGNGIIFPKDKKADLKGTDVNATEKASVAQIIKLGVDKYNAANIMDNSIKVVDADGKAKGKVYIPNSKMGDYYVSEKVAYFDLENIKESIDVSKCVLARQFQYWDNSLTDYPDGFSGTANDPHPF